MGTEKDIANLIGILGEKDLAYECAKRKGGSSRSSVMKEQLCSRVNNAINKWRAKGLQEANKQNHRGGSYRPKASVRLVIPKLFVDVKLIPKGGFKLNQCNSKGRDLRKNCSIHPKRYSAKCSIHPGSLAVSYAWLRKCLTQREGNRCLRFERPPYDGTERG